MSKELEKDMPEILNLLSDAMITIRALKPRHYVDMGNGEERPITNQVDLPVEEKSNAMLEKYMDIWTPIRHERNPF